MININALQKQDYIISILALNRVSPDQKNYCRPKLDLKQNKTKKKKNDLHVVFGINNHQSVINEGSDLAILLG